jgi:hypothetical protein
MDKQTKVEIKVVIREAIQEAMEVYEERWLTDVQIGEYIGVMTKRWLQDHGEMLPRTQIEYTDATGRHSSSWLYPLHRIQAMMADGRIKELRKVS